MIKMELPLMFRVKGTVILQIWRQIVFVLLYTTTLVYLHNYVEGWKIDFPQTIIPVLGVVTGLLLVFRTNTAYDRYWEGRKLWSTMTLNLRTLTRCFWVQIKEEHIPENRNAAKTSSPQSLIIEKISAVNLLVAFAYATRNYLREDYRYNGKSVKELLSHLPRLSTPSSNQSLEEQEEEVKLLISENENGMMNKSTNGFIEKSPNTKRKHSSVRSASLKAYEKAVPTNIPIELSYYISSYINSVEDRGLVKSATVSMMNTSLNSLVECLGGFERILRTPIPLAYSVHLSHATWLYLTALPWQLIGPLNWFAIPAVTLASFALLGILGIGAEIENPFGTDENDLPLNDFCEVIHTEILRIIGNQMPDPQSWLLSEDNHPLHPASLCTAAELEKMSEEEIRKILAESSSINISNKEKEPETKLGWGDCFF